LQGTFYEAQERGLSRDSDEYMRLFDERFPESAGMTAQMRDAARIAGVEESEYMRQYKKMKEQQYDSKSLYGRG
jgi:hypothetical protein